VRRVSIQLVSPASGENVKNGGIGLTFDVSIQLVSPASGEKFSDLRPICEEYNVSIQLVSPASGEKRYSKHLVNTILELGFHSISFPSEWGVTQALFRMLANGLMFPFN